MALEIPPHWNKKLIIWPAALGVGLAGGWIFEKLHPRDVHLTSGAFAVLVAVTLVVFFGTCLTLHLSAKATSGLTRAKIIAFYKEETIFLLSPVDWLSIRSTCAIFLPDENGFEQLICVCVVTNIQDDGKVQLTVATKNSQLTSVWQKLDEGSEATYSKMLVKPGGISDDRLA